MSQVALFVEGSRIDGVASSLCDIKQEDGWEIVAKVIVPRKKDIMFSPPGGDLGVAVCVQENHITLPGFVPIHDVHLGFIWELGEVEDVAFETCRIVYCVLFEGSGFCM